MTMQRTFEIVCDGCGWIEYSHWFASMARQQAKDNGWRLTNKKDLCKECVEQIQLIESTKGETR